MPFPTYVDANDALYRFTAWSFGALSVLGKVRARIEHFVTWEISHLENNAAPSLEGLDHLDSRIVLEFLGTASFVPIGTPPDNLELDYSYTDTTTGASITIGKCVAGSIFHTQGRHMGAFLSAQVFEQVGPQTYTIQA